MNTQPDPALPHLLSDRYDMRQAPSVNVIRRYTNDVFLVDASPERFALKLYGTGWRTDAEIRWEIDLLWHLDAHGVPVGLPIDGRDGQPLQKLDIDGSARQAVLFAFAPGEKPQPPFTPEMYLREGRAAAAMHLAADDFSSPHDRRALDLGTLIDRPLALVSSLDLDDSTIRSIHRFGTQLRQSIERFAGEGLDWGVCHGDLTFDNFHVTEDGQTVWYDFDSGGPGWRAIDLQGWAARLPDRADSWRAFLAGYRDVRPLSEIDIEASPYLIAAQELWGMQVELERRILARGADATRAHCSDVAHHLTSWSDVLGFDCVATGSKP